MIWTYWNTEQREDGWAWAEFLQRSDSAASLRFTGRTTTENSSLKLPSSEIPIVTPGKQIQLENLLACPPHVEDYVLMWRDQGFPPQKQNKNHVRSFIALTCLVFLFGLFLPFIEGFSQYNKRTSQIGYKLNCP